MLQSILRQVEPVVSNQIHSSSFYVRKNHSCPPTHKPHVVSFLIQPLLRQRSRQVRCPASASAVVALAQAGAKFVGKTYTDELAFSMNGKNAHFGTPRNGGAPDRIPGGSSSGSASAVSNGLADVALGTDTGGSVRAPASHCGLIGLRPTHARVSLKGCMDLAPSFDTCGWFARDIDTFARVGEVLLREDTCLLPDGAPS